MFQAGCSFARVAALRSCCAATATVATATAAGTAVAWRVRPHAATVRAATNDLGGAGLPTLSGRDGGASGAACVVMVATAVVVCSGT